MEGFGYSSLAQVSQEAEFRLLSLEARPDIVTLSLYPASLQDKPNYEALSYTWGDSKKRKEIRCNGQFATVPKNLYTALQNLRLPERHRTLWVDAICINQRDNSEKSSQIRIMPQIYQMAQTVLVWIGKADDRTKRTFSEVRRLAAMPKADTDPIYSSDGGAFSGISRDISSMLLRDWFKRIWVVQEVSVCRKVIVVCGALSIDWDDLSAAVFLVAVPGKVVDGWKKTSYTIFEQRRDFDTSKRPHLSQLIVRHQDCLASKAEDKIYALLGRADEVSQHQITVNYDTTIEDIYRRVVLSCLTHSQSLSILGSVQARSTSKLPSLPSWVPDWSVPRTAYTLTFHDEFSSTPALYTAARESMYTWKQPQNKNGLVLSGFQFDRIVAVGYAEEPGILATNFTRRSYINGSREKLLWHLSCERIAEARSNKRYITGEGMHDAYWQTLCAGCTAEAFNTIQKEFHSFDRAMKSLSVLHKVHLSSSRTMLTFIMWGFFIQNFVFPYFGIKSPIKWQGFTDRIGFIEGRRMARTSQGYIGLVPATAELGDCVWLLEGGNVPFILREEGRTMRLVGEAYIHGIMTGEAFDERKCQNVEVV